MRLNNNYFFCDKKHLIFIVLTGGSALSTKSYCEKIILANNTQSIKNITLSISIANHPLMRKKKLTKAPQRKITLFQATLAPRAIAHAPLYIQDVLNIAVLWGKHKQYRYEKKIKRPNKYPQANSAQEKEQQIIQLVEAPPSPEQRKKPTDTLKIESFFAQPRYLKKLLKKQHIREQQLTL